MTFIETLHLVAGIIVLAESLNKLECAKPLGRGLTLGKRGFEALKALAWMLLAIGAANAVFTPAFMALGAQPSRWIAHPTFFETTVMLGVSVLILRTRIKEGP